MSLSFVYGPAGGGKSTYIQDELIRRSEEENGRNFLLIVPDQFTMQTQADIVKRHSRHGIMNVDVLSFGRLSHRIFEEVGEPDEKVLDDTGKSLVIRHVAGAVSEKMPYIGKNLSKVGYVHEVKSAISEFMQYGVDLAKLQAFAATEGNPLLKSKISDLSVIYEEFIKYNKDKFITGEEALDMLCRKLPYSSVVKNAVVVFDGFTGFTPIQERVIGSLMTLADEVIISLTMSDNCEPGTVVEEENIFHLTTHSAIRLIKLAEELKVKRGKDIAVGFSQCPRFEVGSGLEHLEKNLFRYPIRSYEGSNRNIDIFEAENVKTEVEEVILRILKLVREDGYAYRDIAVVTGDLENYGDLFERRMRELEIPHFIDRTRGIGLNPFIEYLKSALMIIVKDYSYDAVFHYLKSGFTSFTEDETDKLDMYVRSLNIRGKKAWHKDFTRFRKGTKAYDAEQKEKAAQETAKRNETRKKLIESMECLERPSVNAGDYVRNLYEFLKANDSFAKLNAYEENFKAENDLARAVEYGQIYRLVMQLLDTIDSLVGDQEMTLDEFYKIFEAGIAEISVGTIPQNVDRIVVGDIERTRLKEIKVLFFAGLNDGNIPKNKDKGGILSAQDREILKDASMELAPTPREEMYSQRLYLYMNMCKPTTRLVLSYAGTDREGKGMRPAYLVGVVKGLFGIADAERVCDIAVAGRIASVKDSYRQFATITRTLAAGEEDEEKLKLAKALIKVYRDINAGEMYKKELDAAFYEYESSELPAAVIDKIYGTTIKATISRMELYAKCAYAHFLQYGLGLKEQEENEIDSRDLGNVYHGVLDLFSQKLMGAGLSWNSFGKEEGDRLLEEAVSEYVGDYEQGILADDATREYTIIKLTRILKRTIETLQFQLKRGHFVPAGFEQHFSREIKVDDEHTINLRGTIDRIDIYEKDGDIYVKIMDYKSSGKDIDVTKVYYGIQQQLGIYMAEAIRKQQEIHPNSTIHPSAMLYYALSNPYIETDSEDEEEILSAIHKSLKMKGMVENSAENLLNLDGQADTVGGVLPVGFNKAGVDTKNVNHSATESQLNNFLSYTERMAERICKRVLDGDISISPMRSDTEDACSHCNFVSVCRYDEKIPGFKARDDRGKTKDEVINTVMEGDSDGDYIFGKPVEGN